MSTRRIFRIIAALAGISCVACGAHAASNPSTFAAPAAIQQPIPYPTLFQITPQMYGAKCDGTSNDRAAFAAADATSASLGPIYVAGGTCVIGTSITLTHDFTFGSGGLLKPASGALITFNGSIQAGPFKIFDTSAGGSILVGSSFRGLSDYVEWWGAGHGVAADDFASFNSALAFAASSLHGLTSYMASAAYTITTTVNAFITSTAGQSIVLEGSGGMSPRISCTGNTACFYWKGNENDSPFDGYRSGMRNFQLIGTNNSADTTATAIKISNNYGFIFDNYNIANFSYGRDFLIDNVAASGPGGFTEGTIFSNGLDSGRIAFEFTAESGGSNSFNGTIWQNETCRMNDVAAYKACITLDHDTFRKTLYNCQINMLMFSAETGNFDYVSAQNSGTANVANEIASCTGRIATDGISPITGADGVLFHAYDLTASSGGIGEFVDDTFTVTGVNPVTLDLSSSSAPPVVPQYAALVSGTDAVGTQTATSIRTSSADVAGPVLAVTIPVAGGRAAYNWDIGLAPYSTYRVSYTGALTPVASNAGNAVYTCVTSLPGSTPSCQLNSNSGAVISGMTVAGSSANNLRITINGAGSSGSDNGQVNVTIERLRS